MKHSWHHTTVVNHTNTFVCLHLMRHFWHHTTVANHTYTCEVETRMWCSEASDSAIGRVVAHTYNRRDGSDAEFGELIARVHREHEEYVLLCDVYVRPAAY